VKNNTCFLKRLKKRRTKAKTKDLSVVKKEEKTINWRRVYEKYGRETESDRQKLKRGGKLSSPIHKLSRGKKEKTKKPKAEAKKKKRPKDSRKRFWKEIHHQSCGKQVISRNEERK